MPWTVPRKQLPRKKPEPLRNSGAKPKVFAAPKTASLKAVPRRAPWSVTAEEESDDDLMMDQTMEDQNDGTNGKEQYDDSQSVAPSASASQRAVPHRTDTTISNAVLDRLQRLDQDRRKEKQKNG